MLFAFGYWSPVVAFRRELHRLVGLLLRGRSPEAVIWQTVELIALHEDIRRRR